MPFIKPIYDMRKNFLLNTINRHLTVRPARVLDCGCGDGYWSSFLSRIDGMQVTGVDYNEFRLGRARRNTPQVLFRCADINDIETQFNCKFDLIWLSQVIEHIEDDRRILAQCHNLLENDGVFIVGTTHEGNLLYKPKVLFTDYKKSSDHVHFYTEKEIVQKIIDAGFVIVGTLYEPFFTVSERLFYWCMKRPFFRNALIEMAKKFPFGCTDFYFACKKSNNSIQARQ